MADNTYRSYRGRDPVPRAQGERPLRQGGSDPLAELARIIGQNAPEGEFSRTTRRSTASEFDEPRQADRPAADDYAEHDYAEQDYPEQNRTDDRYVSPRPSESYPSYSTDPDDRPQDRGFEDERPMDDRQAAFESADDRGSADPAPVPRYGDEQRRFLGLETPEEPYADQEVQNGDDQYYAEEEYDPPPPQYRRRIGAVAVAAMLGLAVLGTAGAFAYRAMFGSSMLPSLPPIIKASNGPNKIVPSPGTAHTAAANETDTGATGSDEKLVSHDEQPVDVQQLVKPAPHVVSTIPVFPDPNSASAVPQTPGAQAGPSGSPWPPSPLAEPAQAQASPPATNRVAASPPAAPPVATASQPKRVRTVSIRPEQSSANAAPPPREAAPAPIAPRAPAARSSGNGPLSLVPADDDAPAPAPVRTRTARGPLATSTPAETVPASAGGYAVQISSQRSEADARASFRSLQARFPNQLGGRTATFRRADLGAKGVYYRALVGPFVSAEQAAGMCSSLKAAGGSCIVQRD